MASIAQQVNEQIFEQQLLVDAAVNFAFGHADKHPQQSYIDSGLIINGQRLQAQWTSYSKTIIFADESMLQINACWKDGAPGTMVVDNIEDGMAWGLLKREVGGPFMLAAR